MVNYKRKLTAILQHLAIHPVAGGRFKENMNLIDMLTVYNSIRQYASPPIPLTTFPLDAISILQRRGWGYRQENR